MGNQQPNHPPTNNHQSEQPLQLEQNRSQISDINLQLQSAIKELQKYGVDCTQFKKGFEKFDRGQNFEGEIGQSGQVIGCGRYYGSVGNHNTVFYGKIKDKKYWGPGILLKKTKVRKGSILLSRSITITNQNDDQLSVTYIQDWSINQHSQGLMKILQGNQQILFKGLFAINEGYDEDSGQEPQYSKGELAIKEDGVLTLIYNGQFRNNNFSGKGKLTIVGKVVYDGEFTNNERNGFGIEEDLIKKTKYIGQFMKDKREGYGELIYQNRENVMLKGFWEDGDVRPGEGIYCTAQGRVLGQVSADDITMN